MISYAKNPKDYTHTHTHTIRINKCKVAGYKVNTQKSTEFLCTNNEQSKNETKKTIPFTLASKRMKYLGSNLTKEVKDLYNRNYTTLMK